jgi:hypothetical protein
MTSTPDTSITIPSTGNIADGQSRRVLVFRGVDPTTPLDVAAVSATGTGTTRFNAAAITPTTAGAFIVVFGGGAASASTTALGTPSGLSGWAAYNGADTNDGSAGGGYYDGWTSGSYDPAAPTTGGSVNAANSWAAWTIALRPAPMAYDMPAGQGSFTLTGQSAALEKGDSVRQGGDPAPLPHLGLLLGSAAALELAIDHGSFTLTGQAADLDADRKLAAAHGSFTLSGQAADIDADRKIAAAHGSFALTGQDVDLDADRKLALTYGGFTLTGQAEDIDADRKLAAAYGSFALTGQDVTLGSALGVTAGLGSFTLAGQDADLDADRRLTFAHGTFSLTGQAADVDADRRLAWTYGGFTLTGQDVAFDIGTSTASGGDPAPLPHLGLLLEAPALSITAGLGSYALAGQASGLKAGRRLSGAYGAITLSGQNINLRSRGYLGLDRGLFTLSGTVSLRAAHKVVAGTGSFVLSGQAMSFDATGGGWYPAPFPHLGMLLYPQAGAYSIGAERGTFTLNGQNVALSTPTMFSIEAGTFTLTGSDADRDISMSAGLGSYTLSGQAVTFGGALSIGAERGNFSLTGRDVTFRLLRSYDLTASVGTYTLTGRAATLRYGHKVPADTGSFTLSGQGADLDADRKLYLDNGSYTVTGFAAGLKEGQSISMATGVFTLTGQSANLAASFVRLYAELGSFTVTFQDATLKPYRLFAETGEFDLNGFGVTLYREEPRDAMIGGGVDRSDKRKFKGYLWRKGLRHYRLQVKAGKFTLRGKSVDFRRTERHDPFHISPEIRKPLLRLPKKVKAPVVTQEVDVDALIAAELKYAAELQAQKRKRRRKQDDEILLLM